MTGIGNGPKIVFEIGELRFTKGGDGLGHNRGGADYCACGSHTI